VAQWGPIQLIPPGLLGFFNLKNSGKNPRTLDDNINPSLELLPWYLCSQQEGLVGTLSIVDTNIGEFQAMTALDTLTVPDQEWWYVHSHSVHVALLSTDSTPAFFPSVSIPLRSGQVFVFGESTNCLTNSALNVSVTAKAEWNRYFPPGTRFGFGGGQFALFDPRTVTTNLVITRLPN